MYHAVPLNYVPVYQIVALYLCVHNYIHVIHVTGSMRNPLVCNVPRVVATSLNQLFVCNDPREFANKQLVQGRYNHPRDVAYSLVSMQRP